MRRNPMADCFPWWPRERGDKVVRTMRTVTIIGFAIGAMIRVALLSGQGPGRGPNFPERPPGDPAAIARGRTLYDTNCSFCHGEDARGGAEGGPNLIRSDYLLRDQNGDVLAPVVQNGIPGTAMAKFTLSGAEVSDIAAFIHSFRVSSRDPGRMRPSSIVVGDPKAGETYFKSRCASCHSVTGDLKDIASRIEDPRTLQQTWIMPAVYG